MVGKAILQLKRSNPLFLLYQPSKAPGPDGFPIVFYQECWDIIKEGLLSFFSEFHLNEKIPKAINSTI